VRACCLRFKRLCQCGKAHRCCNTMFLQVAARFSIAEYLKLARTGPPGWNIYTARGWKLLLYRGHFGGSYFDLRF
jgi:hypothetical protein